MEKNILIDALREDAKTGGLFVSDAEFITYKTGFPVLDYTIGTNINVFDQKGKLKETYPAVGVVGGSYITLVSRPHVGKTTFAIGLAANIVRPFKNGMIIHYDVERSSSITRCAAISKFSIEEMKQKYIFKQINCSLETLKTSIAKLYLEKIHNPDKYRYDSGKLNEFGEKIMPYEPTVVILDSIASVTTYVNPDTKEGQTTIGEISSQTETMRLNGEISRFLKETLEMCKEANITFIIINHIKDKPAVGMPQQADIRYLKQNESIPCGKALLYYSSLMIRLTSVGSEKYNMEEHGFDGFGVNLQFIKSRGSIDGITIPMVYNGKKGYDSVRSNFMFAKDLGMITGNKNGFYFTDDKDHKFRFDSMPEEFAANPELYKVMYSHIIPVLEKRLTSVSPEETIIPKEEMEY